ncbi:unnamed protein product [Protopolystoma xenopodis]|uniref:Transmembrane protein n=1 Tax=Protopolystoma xenopodis TaxID=117903 RepID=A0A448X327_9PLAT|nr:unnamed protein product [Protopolystoma xenopodis]
MLPPSSRLQLNPSSSNRLLPPPSDMSTPPKFVAFTLPRRIVVLSTVSRLHNGSTCLHFRPHHHAPSRRQLMPRTLQSFVCVCLCCVCVLCVCIGILVRMWRLVTWASKTWRPAERNRFGSNTAAATTPLPWRLGK